MPLPGRPGRLKWRDYSLHYESYGNPKQPPVVLVHGILLDSAVNRDLAAALADNDYCVHLLDVLGHGQSDRPPRADANRIDFYGEQIIALLDHLKLKQAVIGGVSLGSLAALAAAVDRPKRVRGLLLEMPLLERAVPAAGFMLMPLLAAVRYGGWLYRPMARAIGKIPAPGRSVWEGLRNAASQDPRDIAAVLHGVFVGPVVPARERRMAIEAPALVIGHGVDWLHNLKDARALADELPNADFVVAKSILELRLKPQRLLPRILRFLDTVHGRQRPPVAVAASGH